MKVAMINGSPRNIKSSSATLLNDLKTCFSSDIEYKDFNFNTPKINADTIKELNNFDVFVCAFPLYVDAIPSHFLSCLCDIENAGISNKNIRVYCVVNSGFYEGKQNAVAIEILKNWCIKLGLVWGMGVGFGGGGAISFLQDCPLGKGPKKSLENAYKDMSEKIMTKSSAENIYVSINFPRFLYKFGAEMGWKQGIKANGKTKKDLSERL